MSLLRSPKGAQHTAHYVWWVLKPGVNQNSFPDTEYAWRILLVRILFSQPQWTHKIEAADIIVMCCFCMICFFLFLGNITGFFSSLRNMALFSYNHAVTALTEAGMGSLLCCGCNRVGVCFCCKYYPKKNTNKTHMIQCNLYNSWNTGLSLLCTKHTDKFRETMILFNQFTKFI